VIASRSLRLLAPVTLALSLDTAQAAPPSGTPVLIELPTDTLAIDVGAGGFVVIGSFSSIGALTWMPTSDTQRIGGTTGVAISRDGKTLVGRALDSRGLENAAVRTADTDWLRLGSFTPDAQPCDRLLSGSFGASDDGQVVVGLGWNGCGYAHAFRWEESTGLVDLGSLNGESTRANNVSGDGRVVVGWQEDPTGPRLGAKWVGRTQEMIRGPFGPVGEAFAVNRDGSMIAGAHCNFLSPVPSGWKWTAANGVQCIQVQRPADLPDLPYSVLIEAMSDDGRVMGGAYSFGLDSEALVWFDDETFFLRDYLRANGVPDAFRGWINTGFLLGTTADGRTLVGYGAGPRGFQGYMVVLPELGSR
jgi:probable HAF family extracellular repeat protein